MVRSQYGRRCHQVRAHDAPIGTQPQAWFATYSRALANDFAPANIAVVNAIDGVVYRSDVLVAAGGPRPVSVLEPSACSQSHWCRPVLILINLRLGIDGVNPIYYESIKSIFTFPQSVGISGGRPSSSYYFVGFQSNCLFYIDPHHTRPAVQLQLPPPELVEAAHTQPLAGFFQAVEGKYWETLDSKNPHAKSNGIALQYEAAGSGDSDVASDASDLLDSDNTWHEARSYVAPGASQTASPSGSAAQRKAHRRAQRTQRREAKIAKRVQRQARKEARRRSSTSALRKQSLIPTAVSVSSKSSLDDFFAQAYSSADLQSFHCERVRKMPLSSLDPSMLVGFLCQTEGEWDDLCDRLREVRTICVLTKW